MRGRKSDRRERGEGEGTGNGEREKESDREPREQVIEKARERETDLAA